MNLLTSYVFRTVINTSLLVFLVFIGLELFVFLMTELINLKAGYGFFEAFVYVITSLPSKIYLSMPIILLLGSLMGLARLATSSELVVMLASGLTHLQIITVSVLAAGVLLIFSVGMGEWLGPLGDRFGHDYKSRTFKARSFQPLRAVWVKSGYDFLHIGEISEDKKSALYVIRFQFNPDHTLKSASFAKKAVFKPNLWEMESVSTTFFKKGGGNQIHHIQKEKWPVLTSLKTLNKQGVIAYQEPLWDLYRSIKYRRTQGLSVIQDEFLFWRRIWHPFSTLLMIIIASPFIFGSLRERSIGSKIVMGILMALVFYILNAFFGPIAAIFEFSPILAAAMPSLLIAVGGLSIYTLRMHRWKQG